MRQLNTIVTAVAVGAASYAGFSVWNEHSYIPASEMNANVTTCASVLGSKAIEAAQLPEMCQGLTDRFQTTTRTTTIDSSDGQVSEKSTTLYRLPTATDFLAHQIITPREETKRKIGLKCFEGALSLVFAGTTYTLLESRRRSQPQLLTSQQLSSQ